MLNPVKMAGNERDGSSSGRLRSRMKMATLDANSVSLPTSFDGLSRLCAPCAPAPLDMLFVGCPRHRADGTARGGAASSSSSEDALTDAESEDWSTDGDEQEAAERAFLPVHKMYSDAGALPSGESEGDGAFGWFEEIEENRNATTAAPGSASLSSLDSGIMKQSIPQEVLEDSLEAQAMWYATNGLWSGHTPRAGEGEGAARANAEVRDIALDPLTQALLPWIVGAHGRKEPPAAFPRLRRAYSQVLLREPCLRGASAAKSFKCRSACCAHIASVELRIPTLRAVEGIDGSCFAEYHVVIRNEGVEFGVWRRFSHFRMLYDAICSRAPELPAEEEGAFRADPYGIEADMMRRRESERFRKSVKCWKELRSRKRWFRCLEVDYLKVKSYLLQRFLQQVLADSADLTLIEAFLGY